MIENVTHEGATLAIIVRAAYTHDGIKFFTPDEFSQQLAFMKHPVGTQIDPHHHNPMERSVTLTQEVLFIRRGRLRVDFFDAGHEYLESRVLGPGDVVLLASGGHGFEVLEELEMFEVKQGPYAGAGEKTRFTCAFEPTVEG